MEMNTGTPEILASELLDQMPTPVFHNLIQEKKQGQKEMYNVHLVAFKQ